ncbi:MAG: hypothetical protein IPP47_24320 [Bryobacterales bacterium]|nr:hypothetical protein [Bryobacterales bacterium]
MQLRFSAVLLIVLFAQVLPGQYYHLVTPADGSVAYFDTDYPRTGTADTRQGRIYTLGGSGLQVYAEHQREVLPSGPYAGTPVYTNYFHLDGASVSSDGETRAFRGARQCLNGKPCAFFDPYEITIQRPGLLDLQTKGGNVQISANGRYALLAQSTRAGSARSELLDLLTGVAQPLASMPVSSFSPGRQVADDGTVVQTQWAALVLFRGGNQYRYQFSSPELLAYELPSEAIIDRTGRVVVYSSRWRQPYSAYLRVRAIDLETGLVWTVAEDFADFYQPVLSDDGRQVLFLTNCRFDQSGLVGPPQVYVTGIDGTGIRPLTNDPAGIREATLSGNGKVAYAVTLAGRLLRIDVSTGEATELLPRTLAVIDNNTYFVAGSLARFRGVGYPGPDGLPEPVNVRMGGMIAPVVSSAPGEVAVQVPWELAGLDLASFSLETVVPPSPFVPPPVAHDILIDALRPEVRPIPPEYGAPGSPSNPYMHVLHSDSRVVNDEAPARPGETVRVVATGLGPVDPLVPTGQPAPLDGPASVLRYPLSCRTSQSATPLAIPIAVAALARGEIGIYHLDLELPAELRPTPAHGNRIIQITCTIEQPYSPQLWVSMPIAW